MTGGQRYLEAARAGVIYQREHFRTLSHDGQYIIWAFGLEENKLIVPSQDGFDKNTIPIYEQVYALAGLAQFYRITLDWETLSDINRTVAAFDKFFLDPEFGGYFSHLDPATLTPSSEALGINKLRKNWNSMGDHIPAYLINLVLALDSLPECDDTKYLCKFLAKCKTLLKTIASLILEKFPDPDPKVPFVYERFFEDWKPDLTWGWQQNRAICGHDLKIAWNLTRVANYHKTLNDEGFAEALMKETTRLGDDMGILAVDQIRSGILDAVERQPKNNMPLEFVWWNTKDFWQQEQGILAYLILYGSTDKSDYLAYAREITAFWNIFFVNHDDGDIYFRVTANGLPYLVGNYRNKGGHAKSGYHTFELCYLAHIYTSTFVTGKSFCLHFKPEPNCGQQSINVLPDFFQPGTLKVKRINVNGVDRALIDPDNFRIELSPSEIGTEIIVEFAPQSGNQ